MLIRPDGDVIYENRQANQLWRERSNAASLLNRLTVASRWSEIIDKLVGDEPVADEPVLLQTAHDEAELNYLTALPQRNSIGELDAVLCVWSARRHGLAGITEETPGETLSEYTRDLEAILEHRTYHHMLRAEQDEHARNVLDHLAVGILIAGTDGAILYRNQAMTDVFGFRPANMLDLHVRHCLSAEALSAFTRAVEMKLRMALRDQDPGGNPAWIECLPLMSGNDVEQMVLQYSRDTAHE